MGGSSSKAKPSKSGKKNSGIDVDNVSVTASAVVSTKGNKRESVKKKSSKGSVKIKASKKTLKKNKSFRGNDSQIVDPIIVADNTGANSELHSTVYRKKSSCPSCEARDILLGKNRSRSGSDKSLRFSDFNKVLRKTRIYDWELEPASIALNDVEELVVDDVCYICGVYTGCHVRNCRVCARAYHDGCLSKIGHALNEKSRQLIASDKWSCHQCVALNHLLTQEEVKEVLNNLDDFGLRKDNLTEADYIEYCKQSQLMDNKIFTAEKEESSRKRFQLVANGNDVICWIQFLNLESIRILNKRCKESLVHLLTQHELADARKMFKQLDKNEMGMIRKADIQELLDNDKSRSTAYYPDDNMMYIDNDPESPVSWGNFLQDRAIYIIGQRPNWGSESSRYCNQSSNNDIAGGGLTCSSVESLDDDAYNTCNSDLERSASHCLAKQTSKSGGTHLDDSTDGHLSSLNTSTNILDEFNSEMEKCCSRHELHGGSDASRGNSISNPDAASLDQVSSQLARMSTNQNQGGSKVEGQGSQSGAKDIRSLNNEKKSDDRKVPQTRMSSDIRLPPDRYSSLRNNDTRQSPASGDDLRTRDIHRCQDDRLRYNQRRSEVVTRRQAPPQPSEPRAVSQIGHRTAGRALVLPPHGNLVEKISQGDSYRL